MTGFFKGIAKGLLYFLFFPFGLIAIFLYAVFGLFVFIFQFIRLIFLFFTGRTLQSDLPEDIEVKKIIEKNNPNTEEKEEEKPAMSLYPSDSIVYGSGYLSPAVEENKEDQEEAEVEEDLNEEETEDDA